MPGPVVADTTFVDSGGTGACTTPPTVLGAPSSGGSARVYVGGKPVVKEGDVFSPVPGTTPNGNPCTSTRTLKGSSTVRVNGVSIGRMGDTLNPGTGITIAAGSNKVFAG
jgi:uncharacterized Zn-binding protein involved in type VI secretion